MPNMKVAQAKEELVKVTRKEDIPHILETLDSDRDRYTACDLATRFAESTMDEASPVITWLRFYTDIYRSQLH